MSETSYERVPHITPPDSTIAEKLKALWEGEGGIAGWLSTVDHKKLGLRYIATSFLFLIAGGIEALVFRLQLAGPNLHLLTPEQYDELYSMHGITMIFLYAFPVLSGFSVYLWPLILGTRDMALPRLNAFSYWNFLLAGIFMYVGFFIGAGPNDGWFNYVPYALRIYNPGPNMDFYALGMVFLGISTTTGSINFIITFMRLRAPGMSVNRVPIMTWGTLTASVANVFAVPAVTLAFWLLWLDRNYGTHFFDPTTGGQPLLWQHLFWMFAHPWVYVIVLPALGMVNAGLPILCRRPIVGYTPVALSTVATMILGFGVWVHHMFATGLPATGLAFFSGASLIIVIPSAVAVFAWIATIWTGRPVFTTAFLFFASFIVMFTVGGVSGFMTAAIPVDLQLTDTYFVVGHIHYVLIGINVFAVVGGLYFWFPKFTGRMLNERLGKWNFWTMFTGFNLGFFPMHISGLLGMPRRIYTYPDGMGWNTLNLITTIGAYIFAVGVLLLIVNIFWCRKRGAIAGPNPWDGYSLEWATTSPPPPYNFAVIPRVAGRHPLWEERLGDSAGRSIIADGAVLDHGKETMGTTNVDAVPNIILKMPEDSFMPILLALALTAFFAGLLIHAWWLISLSFLAGLAFLFGWVWPHRELGQTRSAEHV
jgi:cytochrome c oxidase subunit 1/cytochrome c oxidase subunit I+III